MFDYSQEPRRVILCIDVKSFFASVECVERGLHPLQQLLVVMSNQEREGGLVLAASPKAKQVLGISNVSRKYQLPNHPDLLVVPPRMSLYIKKNQAINQIYRRFVAEEDLHIYSIDESFLDITSSWHLFGTTILEVAQKIQQMVYQQLGLFVTVGIGDNPLLAKLALDNEAKQAKQFIAYWSYERVAETLWRLPQLTDMWGIGERTANRLHRLGIDTVRQLAQANPYRLKESMGVIGLQLQAHANGIDRSRLGENYQPKEKSFGSSQILLRDYTKQTEIEIIIREMADQVAARLRQHHCQTSCIHLFVGFAREELQTGFSHQLKIEATANSQRLAGYCLQLFRRYYQLEAVRQIGISFSRLTWEKGLQLSLFEEPSKQIASEKLDYLIDKIRERYGYQSLVHASSLMQGATAIDRSKLVGGHQS